MKSRLIVVAPFEQVNLASYQEVFVADEQGLQKEIDFLRNKYSRWEETEEITEGCMAVLDMESEDPFFNRTNVKILMGQGLFNRKLEKACLGMKTGSEKTVDIDQKKIKVCVRSVRQKYVPELSDEMCRDLELEDVCDCKSYRAYLIQKQKEDIFDKKGWEVVNYVMDQVCEKSRFELTKSDWKRVTDLEMDRIRTLAKLEGMELEKMTPEEFEGRIPVSSYYELVAMTQDSSWDKLLKYLLGCYYAKQDGIEYGEKEYKESIEDYMKMWNNTLEEAKKIITYDSFIISEYENYFYQKVKNYVKKNFFMEEDEDGNSVRR